MQTLQIGVHVVYLYTTACAHVHVYICIQRKCGRPSMKRCRFTFVAACFAMTEQYSDSRSYFSLTSGWTRKWHSGPKIPFSVRSPQANKWIRLGRRAMMVSFWISWQLPHMTVAVCSYLWNCKNFDDVHNRFRSRTRKTDICYRKPRDVRDW